MKQLITLFALALLSIQATSTHEFHLSKTLLEYNTQEQSLQMSLHIFLDDLELALETQGKKDLFLCTEKETTEAETHLLDYLHQKFHLQVNGKTVNYNFIGKEISDDLAAVWCYLEIPNVRNIEALSITNSILVEIYDDQKNIIQIKGLGKEQTYFLFDRHDTSEEVQF